MAKVKKLKCSNCKKRNATGIIRTKPVCEACYIILNKDNYNRIKEGKPIPTNFSILIPLDEKGRKIRQYN
jgi:hypothetical protein